MVDLNETNSITPEPKKINTKNIISRIKRRILAHYKLVRVLVISILFLLVFLIYQFFNFLLNNTSVAYYKNLAKAFIVAPIENVASFDGRVNILVLGKGGQTHIAGDLTDTIIVASINLKSGNVFLLSLPRDIWVSSLRAKLNSAYYWGNEKTEGGGLILAKSEVEKIVGTPIHYGVVFDFDTFKEVIDVLGGIEVDVQNSFVDEKFPIAGAENEECDGDPEFLCRYETLRFEKGIQKMDGETALKFVRSRNAEGDEGTDLAREARQQKVIEGVRKKMTGRKTLFDYKTIRNLVLLVRSSIETDMEMLEAVTIGRKMLGKREIVSAVIPESFLINPPISRKYDNQYVFVPSAKPQGSGAENWGELQKWILEKINEI